ncbi:Prohibitin-1, subunit of the prohibitin complex (Phb1p-Phb2p) [Saguinus oedipus]|uniref:Prohibitin n=1 Tax=Saguinus oedipus TaxID=9490 RepID=A0ABQ9U9L7_SAGOE|nr:Prohibitin-1, subunit of the prohibitin complex (Phb1p-Phb2p) [Saguinus oedipus]
MSDDLMESSQKRWKPNRWLSRKQRGPDLLWKRLSSRKKEPIISAEGDSKAAELIASSLATAGDGLIKLCKLEAAEDIVYQLSHSRNVTYLPVGQSMLLQLPQ